MFRNGVEHLREAVDRLAELDVDEMSDRELHDAVTALQRQRARLGSVAATLLARWDGRGVWAGDRSRSAASRLARDAHCSLTSANIELRRARKLATMPHTAAAVRAGVLSLDHVDMLGRANQPWRNVVFADHEHTLVELSTKLRFADAVKAVDYWCQRADAVAAEDAAQRRRERGHLYASTALDKMVVINGELDPIGGAIVTGELKRLELDLWLGDERDGVVRTSAQRRAAALVEMASRSATAPANGRRPRPLFTVLVGDDTFSRLCELANGTVITAGELDPYLTAADVETILFDGPSTVLSVSHRRTFTGAVRRAIQVRDRNCQHPSGCDVPAEECDVDHIVPWTAGGETSQFNGRLECPTHNRHADRHDHDAIPLPRRNVTRLDVLRARIRWRQRNDRKGDDEEMDDDGESRAG